MMRCRRRRRNVFGPSGRAKSFVEAWTMTKPEMTKNMSTPASQGKNLVIALNQPDGSPPLVTQSLAMWWKATLMAAKARSA
jgi:hypothetical protein